MVRAAPDLEDDKLRFGLFSPLGRSLSDLSSVLPVMREGLGVGRESVLVGFILCIPVRGASGEGVRSLISLHFQKRNILQFTMAGGYSKVCCCEILN